MIQYWVFITIGIGTIIGSFGAVFLKKASDALNILSWDIIKNRNLIYGILLYGISSVFYIISLKGGDLSIIYPLVSISYVWILILSKYYLNENITTKKIIGVMLIILGIVVMSL